MKKIYSLIYFLTGLSLLWSCSMQDEMVSAIELGTKEETIILSPVAGTCELAVLANSEYTASISGADWLSFDGASVTTGSGDSNLILSHEMNRGQQRSSTIILKSGYRTVEISVIQTGLISGDIAFETSNILIGSEGGAQAAKMHTTLKADALSFTVSYPEGESEGWIEDISKANNFLTFNIMENATTSNRYATVTVVSTSDPNIRASLHICQSAAGAEYTSISFADLKDLVASGADSVIEENYVITGRVINDNSEGNGANNINISSNLKDETRMDRVVYIQNEDATVGIMLEFTTIAGNTLSRYDKAEILLKGLTVSHKASTEKEPERIIISGASVRNILTSEKGSAYDIPVKERTIAQIADADVYTFVTLTDCEIPIRKGPYVPVDLRYTSVMNKYPMILRDKEGSRTYLMTNLNAAWARDGKGLPQGSGSVSGVIVHEKCDNFEWDNEAAAVKMAEGISLDYITEIGTISRYQIRPIVKDEIAIAENFEDGFSDMIMEVRYVNRNFDNLVKNTTPEDYTVFSTYPAVANPLTDPAIKGKFLRWNISKQDKELVALWRDWTHLGPIENGRITNPNDGNGVYDYYGNSAHWTVNSSTASSGIIIDNNGSAWYCSKWAGQQCWLLAFSTEGLTSSNFPLSVNFGAENGLGESVGSARHWVVEYSLDNASWTEVETYTVPDFPIVYQKRAWQCPGFKYISINLPEDESFLGKSEVYVRLRPSGNNAGSADAYDGATINSSAQSALNYVSIRYTK